MGFFGRKKQKTLNVEKNKKYNEKLFFEEKTFSFLKIESLQNWEGKKYADGSRLSCYISFTPVFVAN